MCFLILCRVLVLLWQLLICVQLVMLGLIWWCELYLLIVFLKGMLVVLVVVVWGCGLIIDMLLVSMLNSCGSLLMLVLWMKWLIWVMWLLLWVVWCLVLVLVFFVYIEWNLKIQISWLLQLQCFCWNSIGFLELSLIVRVIRVISGVKRISVMFVRIRFLQCLISGDQLCSGSLDVLNMGILEILMMWLWVCWKVVMFGISRMFIGNCCR